ncbi:hypothetical protein [Herbaspirillum seropedicae]|uniref:hypothetical protein n=1 Tax=Herbaspirillum seropedicae TaxID=964 RepID=UPI0015E0263C|nr:hypothetical protein [Herbaspirillum seropedicae]
MMPSRFMNPTADLIVIGELPQLRLIAWNRDPHDAITDEEAFDLYERNWRFVDQDALEPRERALLDRLVQQYGHGILHV